MKHELKVVNIRLVKEPSLYSTEELTSPEGAVKLMQKELAQYDREILCILNLKTNRQVINLNVVSVGVLDASLVSPREVFKSSILSNAAGILVLHNHPSGKAVPSQHDLAITEKLQRAGALLDIEVQDHIIIGGVTGELYSFQKEGLLNHLTERRSSQYRESYRVKEQER